MNFLFDVDGTLTPSRDKIDSYFEQFFISFCWKNQVYLVTGSDIAKTQEQLGIHVLQAVKGIFACSGNQYIKPTYLIHNEELATGFECVYHNDFDLTEDEESFLEEELKRSGFSVRTGNHIEKRIGTVNFSIVGRNANKDERQQYVIWDNATNERALTCKRLNSTFPRLECVIGGETGIDISLLGHNKSQVRKHLEGPITFFGDRCEDGGNDYPLAKVADVVYNVKNWQETEYILRMKYGQVRS